MELVEQIEVLNKRLADYFGTDTVTSEPIYRIVWSEDQLEKRRTNYTKEGIELLYPEVREMPKYRQWISEKFVLERLSVVPNINQEDLLTKTSYEPLYVYEDGKGNPLPPKWEVTKFAVDCVHAALGKGSLHKYVDPEKTAEEQMVAKAERVNKIHEEMYGNETSVTDALKFGHGVSVPSNYEVSKTNK
jgi:hypothetical protein